MDAYNTKPLAVLIASLLVPVQALAFGLQVMIDGRAVVFSDVSQSAWFSAYVRDAAEAGIVNGYKDEFGNLTGMFGPGNRITVAEALKIAVESAGYDNELYGRMVQSGVDHWASSYLSVAEAEEFAVNRRPPVLNRSATRAEVAGMFADAFRVSRPNSIDESRYDDVKTSTDFATSIEALSRDGILSGDTDDHGQATRQFRPDDGINRAEVTKMAMEARTRYGMPGEGREPSQDQSSEANVIIYSLSGFSPTIMRIQRGESVEFRNDATFGLQVASDPHPSHTDLSSFDALSVHNQGESYFFTFTQVGTWGFHNHVNTSHKGTIIVE